MRLQGKTALITADGSGIGPATRRTAPPKEIKMAQAEHLDALVLESGSGENRIG